MEISSLLEMPVDYRTGGFALTAKTIKKRWQTDIDKSNSPWIHQVLLTDLTGDILADIVRNSNIPFNRGSSIWIIVCEIQPTDTGKKLFIHEWRQESVTEPDEPNWNVNEADKIVRSKVRCWLVASGIQAGQIEVGDGVSACKDEIDKLVDYIVK